LKNETVHHSLGANYSEVTMSIRNVLGKELQTRTLNDVRILNPEIKEPEGVYFIELLGSGGLNVIFRIVKE